MIPLFNAIILDVAVVAIVLLIIFFGALKGIKHTLINFVLLAGSIALSFTSFLNVVKAPIMNLLSDKIVLGAGVANEIKLGMHMTYNFLASFVLTLLFYLIFRLVKVLICMMIKRRNLKANKLPVRVNKVSRFLGGVFGLIFNGALVVIFLSIFATPLVGGDKTLENSYVSKYVEDLDDMIVKLIVDEKEADVFETKILVNLLKGNLYSKVSVESVEDLQDISKLVESGKFIPTNLENVNEVLDHMYHILNFVNTHALDEKGLEVDGFEKAVALTRDMVSNSINEFNSLKGEGPLIEAEKTLAIQNQLKKLGLTEAATTFENVFVIK